MKNIRNKLLVLLGEDQSGRKSTFVVKAIGALIVLSILLAILATEPVIRGPHLDLLAKLDLVVAILFLAEYLSRLWIAPLRVGARKGVRGALDFAITPMAILDLVAIAPTILGFITPELYLLRIIRLARIGRVGRSKRFQKSVRHFNRAITSKKEELQISAIYSAVVISISSALMYLVEGGVQSEQFGSIPRCLWWAVITVTTVGYGDVSPETAAGKIVAAMTALFGIAVIAIPIGIISSGFTDSLSLEKAGLGSKNS
ncbi:potassium transporter Kef [Synechococcus sp. WH 8020]|uniref:ion transporter n=1 Tax=unclassified Synechococcus TaxID=2626047 RepID=UPI0006526BB3|nr:ion transporter [Synechococcus sp. WH 8020]AKN61951.1 potassium transporter Kef [Synechococcus sp. WH 8020]